MKHTHTSCPYCKTRFAVALASCSFCGRSFAPLWTTTQRVRVIQVVISAGIFIGVILLAIYG